MTAITQSFSLKDHNSFGVEATAAFFSAPESMDQLSELISDYDINNLPFLVMGEGSNLLFKSDYEGLIIRPMMRGIEITEEDKDRVTVTVGAAENWDHWVHHATSNGWFGLENLSLIPGSVGSVPVQNIGAYGVEIKDHFAWLEALDLQNNQVVTLAKEDCKFEYRNSIFKSADPGRYIITRVAFHLHKVPVLKLDYGPVRDAFAAAGGSSPADLRNTIIQIRKSKLPDPLAYGNAGSFFKNPVVDRAIFKCIRVDYPNIPNYHERDNQVKIPAAWLMEQAGWKDKRIGNVGTWPNQPLVIVNYGSASGQEIVDFSEQIRDDLDKKFGIYFEREVNVIG